MLYRNKNFIAVSLIILIIVINSSVSLGNVENTKSDSFIDYNVVDRIKIYIQNIKSVAINFTQRDSQGGQANGILIIDKPYKFRCNYDDPFPLLIIGNKNYISIYDYEMESLSRMDAKDNALYFLLLDSSNFEDRFDILFAKKIGNKSVLELMHKDLERRSQIKRYFLRIDSAYSQTSSSGKSVVTS